MKTFVVGRQIKYQDKVYLANTEIMIADEDVEQIRKLGGWEVSHNSPFNTPEAEPVKEQQAPRKPGKKKKEG